MKREPQPDVWWKDWPLEPESGAVWEIGPLALEVFRGSEEWVIGQRTRSDELDPQPPWSYTRTESRPAEGDLERFVCGQTTDELRLTPRVADRSVVARPRTPLHLLPSEKLTIYVSSPVWVEASIGGRILMEVPSRRLSDTWFGSSTREGEVAYALNTIARSTLAEVRHLPYRAITPVLVRNESSEQLHLDRMSLSVPYLSIYATAEGALWTERLELASRDDHEMATLDAGSGPPNEAGGAVRVSGARQDRSDGLLVRAFSSILRTLNVES